MKYIPGQGPLGASLFILGEAPSWEEEQEGKPFVGPAGRELNKLCKDADVPRESAWVSNVFKYMIPSNPKGKRIPAWVRAKMAGIDVDNSLKELQEEINGIKPNCILALGNTALWALSGKTKITNYRGSIMLGMGRKFVSTYHPAHLLHVDSGEFKGYWNRQLMIFDFKRAYKQSKFPELILPQRNLQIARSSSDLHEFYQRYKSKSKLAIDIESRGHCIPVCIGLAFNKNHGMTVPLWNVDNISSIPDSDMISIWILLSEILMNHDIIGQNFNYDKDKIRRLGFTIRRLISDTMLKAFAINPELPKSLAFNTSIYTEEPFYKDDGMYEGSIQDLLLGCARDACVTYEINDAMDADIDELNQRPFYEDFLMKLPEFYLEIENTGFKVNTLVRDQLIEKYIKWDERLRFELYQLTKEVVNVNSPKQVRELLFVKLGMPTREGTGEEELTSLLNLQSFTNETHRRIVELVLEDRRVRKTVSTYLMALPDYDGRMRTTCFPCLETGRSNNGQQDPPIRPTVEVIGEDGKKKKKSMGMAFQTITKHGDIGQDVRSQFEPDDGYIFVQGDSEQAEARVMSLLAQDEKALQAYDNHDIHALTASWFFGGTESQYSKKILGYECPERFIGKTLRHSGERGAKKRRAATEVNTSARKYKLPIKITEAQAEIALRTLHRNIPNIESVYFKEVVAVLQKNRNLIAPVPYGVKAEYGGQRTFFERWSDELFRQAFSYLPQRSVTDNTKAAGIRIKKLIPWVKIIMESHDSLLFMVPINRTNEAALIIKKEMERPLDFSNCSLPRHSLSIPCAIETGFNFQDLSKFKFRETEIVKSNV